MQFLVGVCMSQSTTILPAVMRWMGRLHRFPWFERWYQFVANGSRGKQTAYAADITALSTNNEFGFDYLRDNMVLAQVSG